MSNARSSRWYRNFTQSILTKMVSPQLLGSTAELSQRLQAEPHVPVCYVVEDEYVSNNVLIDQQAQQQNLPSALKPIHIGQHQERDALLILNEKNPQDVPYHYASKLIRFIEVLEQNPEADVQLVPVTVLWGRAPDYEDSWVKALFSDAWAKPSHLKQMLNVSLYGKDNYIEFHKPLSLRALLNEAKVQQPNYSPAHFIASYLVNDLNKSKEAILGPDLSDRRNLIQQLLHSEAIQKAVTQESIHKKISMFEAENRAKSYLNEITSDFSYSTLRFAALSLEKLWTQLYDGIEVHNFDTVRELAKDYEIVYTPCHRSHIDYLLLSYVIFNRGLMVPHIAAGINLNLPVVGNILRGAGAYFIRRSFNGNMLYTAVFKEYVHSLLSRNSPIEYFIEGGRSRTGLLLPPKKGMLSMTVHSYLRGSSKPIAFIPTYFGYEKLFEGSSYIHELNGKPKEAESVWGLLSSVRKIEKVFGLVHVNFGDPIYLDDILSQNEVQDLQLSIDDDLPKSVITSVNQTAQAILENINKAAVLNPIALLSLLLLKAPEHRIEQDTLIQQLDDYRQILKLSPYDARMMMTELSGSAIIDYALKLKQIDQHQVDGIGFIQVSDKQKGLLNYFSNNILHSFVLPALVATALINGQQNSNDIQNYVAKLYPFFKEELFLKWQADELEHVVEQLLQAFAQLDWIGLDHTSINVQQPLAVQALADIIASSLTNFRLMAEILSQFAHSNSLGLSKLEKLTKIALKNLLASGHLANSFYFDKSTVKTFSQGLKLTQLAQVQGGSIQLAQSNALDFFQAQQPIMQQALTEATHFSDKVLKDFELQQA
ncbi:glycerol-3-phosphate 1-O-acyltransferase PlsB [Acinetobacter sp.]|uniref:glycerol-3-phosphate 1-O-acyltransferase PlsB n=1 Tax=Acinetobacter sp. TaxID=472 RepID=UPI00388F39E9